MIDTGVLISRILKPLSMPAQAVAKATRGGVILILEELVTELADVLARPKLAAYIDASEVRAFIQALAGIAEVVPVTANVRACRDPDDDHLLALALSGEADVIISGDADLLALDPFQQIPILTPRRYIEKGQ